jgi:hypothetical protein
VQGLRERELVYVMVLSVSEPVWYLVEMRMERWWNDADRVKLMCLDKKPNHYYVVNLKSPMG